MTTEFAKADSAAPFEKLTLLLIGQEKSGKSWLAATARPPVLFIDTDLRRESITVATKALGMKDIYVISLKDPAWPTMPTAYGEALDIITALEKSADLGQWWPEAVGQQVKTIVFDSIQTLARCARGYALYSTPSIRREINIGGKISIQVPKSWDGWGIEMGMVESLLMRALALPNVDIVATLHEAPEEAPDSTDEAPRFTGKVTVYPARYKLLLKSFNEVWHVVRETGKVPRIDVIPTWQFQNAATNLGIETVDVPNITKLIEKALSK